jgi:membrane associated rhomboid family serine protease
MPVSQDEAMTTPLGKPTKGFWATVLPDTDRSSRVEAARGPIAVVASAALMWGIEIIDWLIDHRLDRFGVRPRSVVGLRGIPLAPFLHGGFGHLAANTVPFVAMGVLVSLGGLARMATATAIIAVVSGLFMWLLGGRSEVHIGASGVVFGFLSYLVSRGWFERKFLLIALGIVVALIFGRIITGVIPTSAGISWQGHLGGAVGGVVAARLLARPDGRKKPGIP